MTTTVIKIDLAEPDTGQIHTAAQIVRSGGLVAFPTETVYGIACVAEAAALKRLDSAKIRADGKRYTLHVSAPSVIERYVPRIAPRAKKLMAKALPGPVTIVFELDKDSLGYQKRLLGTESFDILYQGGTIGIRCPDNRIAAMLLENVDRSVVAPSANILGGVPATSAQGVIEQLEGRIDMVIDGGKECCKYKKPSTVVKVGGGAVTILREGVYSAGQINALSQVRILFVCTGNTCRSPMAEAFCRKYISEKLACDIDQLEQNGYIISSAGTGGGGSGPVSAGAAAICGAEGVDISGHRSTPISRKLLDESDYIFVMTGGHGEYIGQMSPQAAQRCFLLDRLADIADPIGGSEAVYQNCASQIKRNVRQRISEIWNEDNAGK